MTSPDADFLKQLFATFETESDEHIAAISAGLVELENTPSQERKTGIVETIYREAHSLKGAAGAVNLGKVETACQSLETILSQIRNSGRELTQELFDRLHQLVGTASAGIAAAAGAPFPSAAEMSTGETSTLARGGEQIPGSPSPISDERTGMADTIRISSSKLDAILQQTEELIASKAAAASRAGESRAIREALSVWDREWRVVRPQVRSLQRKVQCDGSQSCGHGSNGASPEIQSVLAFCESNERLIGTISSRVVDLGAALNNDRRLLERRVGDLLDEVKRASMVPFSALFAGFPKLVRDLSRECGKDAELILWGAEIEVSRRILEELKDPLIHLIRNCIDHGIESPAQRQRKGKPPRATITITVSPKARDRVELSLSDTGEGIDIRKVIAVATRKGLISADEAQNLDEQDALSLIFHSGFSTNSEVTQVSGRGLGLAIVREKVQGLGGNVSVETKPDVGTTFGLMLPLTIATFRGILVRTGEYFFFLPTMYVKRALRVDPDHIRSAENRAVIDLGGQAVSVVCLKDVLAIGGGGARHDPKQKRPGVLLEWNGERILFLVDEVIRDQEVLIKSLGSQLVHVRNISGSALLETGRLAPVLNVAELMLSAASFDAVCATEGEEKKLKSILVAEDSITARTLLKGILESAGYRATTAVNGAEAFRILENQTFDLVVSDIEMPHMNGLELTARIRASPRLRDMPVVLVTSLDSREDRERGAEVGANAYVVKSGFDQSNLLEIVQRLI